MNIYPDKYLSKICCIGAGYVGVCTSAVLAYKNPSIEVIVVDRSESTISAWNSDNIPISEPGLKTILRKITSSKCESARDKQNSPMQEDQQRPHPQLRFSTDIKGGIRGAELIFICVDTPTKKNSHGDNADIETKSVEACVKTIIDVSISNKIIVEKSTVPCGTANRLRELIVNSDTKGLRYEILSNPEFLAEGTAIENLIHPDRIIIGSKNSPAAILASAKLASLYKAWVPSDRIITISNWSSELAKLAANAMLAQRISSINSLSTLCEAVGADVHDVGRVIGLDQRIGPHMLQPSIGFGGSCFEKDIRCLAYLANSLGLGNIARYWSAILSMNDFQKSRQVERIIDLAKSFALRRVAILGFAFKEHTGDIRGTPALAIVKDFVERGFAVRIFDPSATRENILGLLNQEISFLGNSTSVTISSSATEACKEVEAIVIATAWDEFRTSSKSSLIDWHDIACGMQGPRVIFDGCNVIDAEFLRSLGINVIELGRRQPIL